MKFLEIKKKLINHLMINGEKKTSEKILLQSLKELQKSSLKQTKELIKNALAYSTPIFKLHIIENKKQKKKNRKIKEIPSFIYSNTSRVSLAIKIIIEAVKKQKHKFFATKLNKEILLNSQQKGDAIQLKNDLQKKVLLNKRYFYFYRWR